MTILLFDIDGTLIMSGGAGMRGMNRAFTDLFHIDNALDGLTVSGMTDKIIFRNACKKTNVAFSEEGHNRFKEKYIEHLREEIEKPGTGKMVLPGVENLLMALSTDPEIKLGLLTGNYSPTAKIKLAHFGLAGYFSFGAFGDDDEDRNKLLPYAVQRYTEKFGGNGKAGNVWVIGDTPKDVACARPHGARAIAVATGGHSLGELEKSEPDALLADLGDIAQFLEIIKKMAEPGTNNQSDALF
jgi:phosphoglycolate phosphatase-like HAD superfamily hydrolase